MKEIYAVVPEYFKALPYKETEVDAESALNIERLDFLICRGGWPQAVNMRDEIALYQAMDYYDAVVRSDINRADNVQKNPERVRRLMRSYARNQGGQMPNTVLAQDIAANDESHINEETVIGPKDLINDLKTYDKKTYCSSCKFSVIPSALKKGNMFTCQVYR